MLSAIIVFSLTGEVFLGECTSDVIGLVECEQQGLKYGIIEEILESQ